METDAIYQFLLSERDRVKIKTGIPLPGYKNEYTEDGRNLILSYIDSLIIIRIHELTLVELDRINSSTMVAFVG